MKWRDKKNKQLSGMAGFSELSNVLNVLTGHGNSRNIHLTNLSGNKNWRTRLNGQNLNIDMHNTILNSCLQAQALSVI